MMQYANSPAAKKNATMTRYIFSAIVAAAVVYLGFQTYVYAEKIRFNREVWGDREMSVVNSHINFTLELYTQIVRSQNKENIFLSPFSVLVAILMTSLGARGNTSQQIYDTLSLDTGLSRDDLHDTYKFLLHAFESQEKCILHLANGLFVHKDSRLEDTFRNEVRFFYYAKPVYLDFIYDTENSRTFINQWVEDQTKQTIKELIKPGILSSDTKLSLVNAIYFRGQWETKFKEANTRTAPFYTNSGKQLLVKMMSMAGKFKHGFIFDLNAHVLELPYTGNDLYMTLLLPERNSGLENLETKLTSDTLSNIQRELHTSQIHVSIPKFKLTQDFSLADILSQMGIKDLFMENVADLSGINRNQNLHVSHVIHKAFVEVNEEGVEAAAATAVGIVATSIMEPAVFRADHPFLFYIQDRKSGVILFLGRYTQPEPDVDKDEL